MSIPQASAAGYGEEEWLTKLRDKSNVQSSDEWHFPRDGLASTKPLMKSFRNNYQSDPVGVRAAIEKIVYALGESDFLDIRIHLQIGWYLNACNHVAYRNPAQLGHIDKDLQINGIFAEFQVKRWIAEPAGLERYTHLALWAGLIDKRTLHFFQSVPVMVEATFERSTSKNDRHFWQASRGYLLAACLTNEHISVAEIDLESSFKNWFSKFKDSVLTGQLRSSRLSPTWVLKARSNGRVGRKIDRVPALVVRPSVPLPGQTLVSDSLTAREMRQIMEEII